MTQPHLSGVTWDDIKQQALNIDPSLTTAPHKFTPLILQDRAKKPCEPSPLAVPEDRHKPAW